MNDLIINQRKIPKDQWRYGLRSSAATGCGWIATYNAMRLLGWRAEPEDLIRYYERQLPLIHGNAGTTVLGPVICFKQWGFPVTVEMNPERFDDLGRGSDACILFYHWQKKWKFGAHFVALHHTDRGFIGYNTYKNSTGEDLYGESLTEFLKEKKYYGAVLIGIQKK